MNSDTLHIFDLGLIDYEEAYAFQLDKVKEVIAGNVTSALILCEHPNVLTLGRMTKSDSLFFSEDEFKRRGINVIKTDRGGDVTLHAPGQLVVYPVLNLNNYGRDLHKYLHQLEDVAIAFLSEFGIMAKRSEVNTGAWVDTKKIVSIGIGVKKWIAFHGLGINVSTDLDLFKMMRPCGLDIEMTSMQKELSKNISIDDIKNKLIETFLQSFNLKRCEVKEYERTQAS